MAVKGRKILDCDNKLERLVKRLKLRNYDEFIAIEYVWLICVIALIFVTRYDKVFSMDKIGTDIVNLHLNDQKKLEDYTFIKFNGGIAISS